jgi:DNA primase
MAGTIPRDFIDRLLERVDIVDLVGARVPLKKAGRDFQACCPFHTEKTPSFTVSQTKQFYHCFGCGAHGSAIGFLMAYDRLSFPEAVEELARQAGMEVPHEAGTERRGPDLQPIYDTLEQAARFYAQQLRRHPEARRAADYLKGRGLTGETALAFGLGYAPPAWDALLSALGTDADAVRRLETAGLLAGEGDRRYDRFRDRIMFPIRDSRGRVVGFGGRILGDGKPKYLNSPETPVFHKGRELYGLHEARRAPGPLERLLVVEGYMDVIALVQHGIAQVVATLGTATTGDHLDRLYRAAPAVVFCFDGDRAGLDAAWKALNAALPQLREGREARFLFLPEGEDPDTLVRKEGANAFRSRVARAQPLSEYFYDHLGEGLDLASLDGRARLAARARPLLGQIPPGAFRELMERRLTEITGVASPGARPPPAPSPRPPSPSRAGLGTVPPVRRAIALLLHRPDVAAQPDLPNGWQEAELPGIELLRELVDLAGRRPDISPAALVDRWEDPEIRRQLNAVQAMPIDLLEADLPANFAGTLRRIAEQARREAADRLLRKNDLTSLTDQEKEQLRALSRERAAGPDPGA